MSGMIGMSSAAAGLAKAAVFGLGLLSSASAQESESPAGKIPLEVLYLGSPGDSDPGGEDAASRFEAYRVFLAREFAVAEVLNREDFEPGFEQGFDVVILDWAQRDLDEDRMVGLASPLGSREQWTTPTVLLGSAGLLLASPWQLPGSWG